MKIMTLLALPLLCSALVAGCGDAKPRRKLGACVVGYDDAVGGRSLACMFPAEQHECDDPDGLPPIFPSGGTAAIAKHVFMAGQSCDALGYDQHDCSDVAIAWSFDDSCP